MTTVDWSRYSDPGRVGDLALAIADRIRDEDPREVFDDAVNFAHRYPSRCAQVLIALAALVDPNEGDARLNERLAAVSANQVELVRLGRRPWPGRHAS